MACCFIGMFDAQGYPGGPPRQTGGTWPDYAIASSVVFHALAALRHRNRTGEGQWIDASMGETVIGQMHEWFTDYFMNGRDRRQWGNRDDVMAPHNTYRCAGDDHWIAIAVANQCRMGSALPRDGRSGVGARREVRRSARPLAESRRTRCASRGVDARSRPSRAGRAAAAAGVAAGPVLDSVEMHNDPHLWEWGYWWKMDHHEVGERILPGMPVKLSNVPRIELLDPPDLGEHNREVFGGLLGLTDAEIKMLMEEKVIY